MINPTTHVMEEFPIDASGDDQAEGITVGPDGNLWLTLTGTDKIAVMSPSTGPPSRIRGQDRGCRSRFHHARSGWQSLVHRVGDGEYRNDHHGGPSDGVLHRLGSSRNHIGVGWQSLVRNVECERDRFDRARFAHGNSLSVHDELERRRSRHHVRQ